jgi:hypothetical protein
MASLFRGRHSTLDRWSGKLAKRIGTRLSALHFPFLKEVLRNCFGFDVAISKLEEFSQDDIVNFQI